MFSKYNNKWTEYNQVKYQSAKEAKFAQELDLRLKANDIKAWERQVKFPIIVNGENICTYLCDFAVTHNNGKIQFIDIKGMKSGVPYQMFKLKKKLVEALFNIEIEVL